MIPWVYTTSPESVNVNFIGQGRPIENLKECVRGYVPLPVIVVPPRTCDDFYEYKANKIHDEWTSVLDQEV